MSKSNGNGKPLRFAALIRVSTEKQEEQGESLRTQKKQIAEAVKQLNGGKIEWYGGQEHGTPGYEKKEVDRLIHDASRAKFDAVMITHEWRWSRDNKKSEEGLSTFVAHGVRFFVRTHEYNLSDPQQEFIIAQFVNIGKLNAAVLAKASIENRIERAKRGIPTGGGLPFGRLYNKETGKWSIDKDEHDMIRDVAERYLAGEQLKKLTKEYGVNHSNINRVLRDRCGTEWAIHFNYPRYGINEVVKFSIPRLLPEKTIKAIRLKKKANQTYEHGRPKHNYLLNGRVFCAKCGYSYIPQASKQGKIYYRHGHQNGAEQCPVPKPRPYIQGKELEKAVLRKLFEMLGSPAAMERSIKAAVPDCDKLLKQLERVQKDRATISKGRERILKLISQDVISEAQAKRELTDLKERDDVLAAKCDALDDQLANVPDANMLRL